MTDRVARRLDALSAAVLAAFFLNGLVFATWASRLPAIRDILGASPSVMGRVMLVGSLGALVALPTMGKIIGRWGARRSMRVAAVLAVVGAVCAALSLREGSVWWVLAPLFVMNGGVAAWDSAMNVEGGRAEHVTGRAIMPWFHAAFSMGAVVGSLGGAAAAQVELSVPLHLCLVMAVCAVAMWWLTRRTGVFAGPGGEAVASHPDGGPEASAASAGSAVPSGGAVPPEAPTPPAAPSAWREWWVVATGVVALAAAMTEGAGNDWLALAMVDGFGLSQSAGAAVFGLFIAVMTVVRMLGATLLARFGRVRVVRWSNASALIGCIGFAAAPTWPLSLLGVALWAAGAALAFPIAMSAASDEPARAAARVSVVATIGYTAFFLGPPLLGELAHLVGYHHALAAVAVPALISLAVSRAVPDTRTSARGEPDRVAVG